MSPRRASEAEKAAARLQREAARELECSVDGCARRQKAGTGGMCHSHYRRSRAGQMDRPIREHKRAAADDRFDAKVLRRGPDDCWEWTAAINRYGYGLFRVRTGFQMSAHRYAWQRQNGPVPDGLVLDHLCHPVDGSCLGGLACLHRRCVNPSHCTPITRGDNSRRHAPRAVIGTLRA